MQVTTLARAKVNLCLHVTGRRGDGYHLLDSLVVFADISDVVTVTAADRLALRIDGPEAQGLAADDSNLVMRAARLIAPDLRADIRLTKNLPVASGIGGGSADAAATLRAIARMAGTPMPPEPALLRLGSDVPACLASAPCRMRGIGDDLGHVPSLPALDVLLVNPRVMVSTPAVFAALDQRDNAPLPALLPDWPDAARFCDWLSQQRNDLLAPALTLAPEIATALAVIRDTGCLFAGMSGSGATCFGLYPRDGHSAKSAEAHLFVERPAWWAKSGRIS